MKGRNPTTQSNSCLGFALAGSPFLPAGHAQGTKIALCSHIGVCVRLQLSCVLSYVTSFRYYATIYWKIAGSIGQSRLVLCCLDGEKVVGNDDNSSSDR